MDLNRDDILNLIDELLQLLLLSRYEGTITIYGGSAVAYYHEARGVTKDVDSAYVQSPTLETAIAEVAKAHPGLESSWLNRSVESVLPPRPDVNPTVYFEEKGLRIQFASEEYLLAMKATSTRRTVQDRYDAALLYNSLKLSSWLDINTVVTHYFGGSKNWGSQELFWEDIEDEARAISGDV